MRGIEFGHGAEFIKDDRLWASRGKDPVYGSFGQDRIYGGKSRGLPRRRSHRDVIFADLTGTVSHPPRHPSQPGQRAQSQQITEEIEPQYGAARSPGAGD